MMDRVGGGVHPPLPAITHVEAQRPVLQRRVHAGAPSGHDSVRFGAGRAEDVPSGNWLKKWLPGKRAEPGPRGAGPAQPAPETLNPFTQPAQLSAALAAQRVKEGLRELKPKKLRKVQRPAPPPVIHSTWFSRKATEAHLQQQAAAPHLSRRDFEANVVETRDGEGLLLDGGRLYQWNHIDGRWDRMPLSNIAKLRLGADGHAYAGRTDGRVIPMGGGAGGGHRLHADTTDFVVLPSGALVELRTRAGPSASSSRAIAPPAQRLTMRAAPASSGSATPAEPLPLPPRAGELRSLAFTNEGQLYALDALGDVWRVPLMRLATDKNAQRWTQVEVSSLPPGRRLDALKCLADGTVVGIDLEGQCWPPAPGHDGWVLRSGDEPPSLETLYARFPAGPIGTENVTLAGPIPGAEKLRVSDKKFMKPSFLHRDYPGQSLWHRYFEWWRVHAGPKPHLGAQVRAATREDWDALRNRALASLDDSPRLRRDVNRQIGSLVNANSKKALRAIEQGLGFVGLDGVPREGRPDTKAFRRVFVPAKARSDDNVLWQVLRLLESLNPGRSADGDTQEVMQRIRRLVEAGVFLPVKSSRKVFVVREQGQTARLVKARNPFGGPTGKLLHDHAIWLNAVIDAVTRVKVGAAQGGEYGNATGDDVRRLLHDHAEQVDGGAGNYISRLFEQQVVDLEALHRKGTAKALKKELKAQHAELKVGRPVEAAGRAEGAAPPPLNALVAAQIGQPVLHRANEVLDLLDVAIGRRHPDGSANPAFARDKRVHAPRESQVRSDDNVVHLAHRKLVQAYRGVDDAQAQAVIGRMDGLLREGVFLSAGSARSLLAGLKPSFLPTLHITKNKATVLTSRLVQLLSVLERARSLAAEAGGDDARVQAICREQAERIDGGEGARLAELVRKGIANLDRATKGLEAMDNALLGMSDKRTAMNRAMRMQGAVRDAEPVEAYIKLWQRMKAGDSVKFTQVGQVILDADGWSHVFRTNHRDQDGVPFFKFNLKFNVIPNVQPVPMVSALREGSFSMVRTDNGAEFAFGKVSEHEAKVAAKLMWGGGAVGKLSEEQLIGVLYAGFEVIPGISIKLRNDNTLTLQVSQDDEGRVQRLMRDIFSGAVSPFELMAVCLTAKTQRSVNKSVAGHLDAHGLAAAVGILGLGEERGKLVLATLAQLSGETRYTWGHSSEQGPDGRTDVRVSKVENKLQAKKIEVVEAQFSKIVPTNNPQKSGGVINDGYENEQKVPLFIKVWVANIFGTGVTANGISFDTARNGEVTGASVLVQTHNSPVSDVLSKVGAHKGAVGAKAFNEKNIPPLATLLTQLPELREYLQKINKSGLDAQALLEVTPAALAQVRALGPNADRDALARTVQRLVENPANLRVAKITVGSSHTFKTGKFFGFSMLRLRSGADNTYNVNRATISITYDDEGGGRPRANLSGDLLLGDNARPDFSQARRVLAEGGSAHMRWLSDPVGNDAERRFLASLPHKPTAEGTGLNLARGLVKALPLPGAAAARPHVGLLNGHLVYRQPSADGRHWRTVDVPPALHAALVPAIDRHLFGRLGGESSLLVAMSHGETGVLGPASMANGHADTLRRLADDRHVVEAHHALPPAADRIGRALHVSDILDSLATGKLQLDTGQMHVLRCYFPAPGGNVDQERLSLLLNDRSQLAMFKASVQRVAERAGVRVLMGPQRMPSDDRIDTIVQASSNGQHGTTSVPSHTAT